MNRKRFFKKFRRRLRKKHRRISEKFKTIRFKCYRIWKKHWVFLVFLFLYVSIMVNNLLVSSKLFSSPPLKIEKKAPGVYHKHQENSITSVFYVHVTRNATLLRCEFEARLSE